MRFKLRKDGYCCICNETSWCYANGLYFCAEHNEEAEGFVMNRLVGELQYHTYAKILVGTK